MASLLKGSSALLRAAKASSRRFSTAGVVSGLDREKSVEDYERVLDKFAEHDVASLCVVSPIDDTLPIGVITRREVLKRYRRALEEG